jgi:hypothetical protein
MPEDINTVMEKAAEYVATTQPLLDKQAADAHKWNTQAQRTAAVLADRGCLKREKVDGFVDKIAEDPSYALLYLEKIAGLVGTPQMGGPSEEVTKVAEAEGVDPFIREYCSDITGSPAASGYID